MLTKIQKISLTRKAKRILRKAKLPHWFIEDSYIWEPSYNGAILGNYLSSLESGVADRLSNKAFNRLCSILPHLSKELKKTAVACKYYNDLKWYKNWPFNGSEIIFHKHG